MSKINFTALQTKIFNIVKKKSFTPTNMIKILRNVIKEKNSGHISTLDVVEGTLMTNRSHFAKKISALYKNEKILPKNHRKLNPERQELVNKIYADFLKIKGFHVPKEGFEYILNKIISRISKDVKIENMAKLNIVRDIDNNWNALEYAHATKLIDVDIEEEQDDEIISVEAGDYDTVEYEFDIDIDSIFDDDIKLFRQTIINNMGLTHDNDFEFIEEMLSNDELKDILNTNFDGDVKKAISVINGEKSSFYTKLMDKRIDDVHGLGDSVKQIIEKLETGKKVLFITDSDNDGSSGQAGLNVFQRTLPKSMADLITIKFAKVPSGANMSHGLNALHIKQMIESGEIEPEEISLLVTVDNGMSLTKEETDEIFKLLPNADLRITDHHLPSENLVKETLDVKKVRICNPKFNPTKYFNGEKNISGAQTINEILKRSLVELENKNPSLTFGNTAQAISVIDNISKFSNIADVINSDITQYPSKSYDVDRLSGVSTLMNVINNMNTFIGKEVPSDAVATLFNIEGEEGVAFSNTLLYLNSIAKEYIELFDELFGRDEIQYALNEKNFSKLFADIHRGFKVEEHDENYIALLRPILIELTNDSNKNIFKTKFLENVEKVFHELKKLQVKVVDAVRTNPLNFVEDAKKLGLETDKVSILIKKDTPELRQVPINRKLLNIALNEANNGFRAILDGKEDEVLKGSLRSLYPKSALFKNMSEINKELGIEQSLMGHETAAGWRINIPNLSKMSDKEKYKKLSSLTNWIDESVKSHEAELVEMKGQEKGAKVYPTEKVGLLLKANSLLRSTFQGKKGIDNNIYLDEYQLETLSRKIENSQYGWVTLDTKIMDATIIMPNEVLKQFIAMKKDGRNVSLNFHTLTSGAMILQSIRENDKDVYIEKDKTLDTYYEEYIKANYHDNIEHLTNADLQKQPYFQYNKYGDIEFQRMQAAIIELMHRYNLSDYNILDIEGTGLAMSEQIPEISTLTLRIHEGSGSTLNRDDFLERSFISHGREILIDAEDLDNLVSISDEEKDEHDPQYLIFNEDSERWFYNSSKKHYPEVFSKVEKGDEIVYNQQLIGSHIHAYVNDLVENIPTAIESLTHLNNDFVKNSGNSLSRKDADELFYNYFSSMDKSLLSAHNLSYDYSLIRSNFPKTFDFMHKEMLLYDTAKTSQAVRIQSQQFASITLPIAIGDLPNPEVKFKNYFGNDLSLEEFFNDLSDGNEIADRSGRFFLKITNNNLVFIDRDKDISAILLDGVREMEIENIKEWLNLKTEVSVAPKYSVQSLLHEKYVKMMLHKIKPIMGMKKNYNRVPTLPVFNEEFQDFIRKYRFENSTIENFNTFVDYINVKYKELELPDGEFVIKHLLSQHNPYVPEKGKKPSVRAANQHVNKIYNQFVDMVKNGLEDFIIDNKEISALYTNRFYVEEVIHLLPENLDRITPETVRNISSKTSYSETVVNEIIGYVREFEKSNGINVFAIEEVHNNLVGKDSTKMGDVALEGMLVIVHLLNEKYNFLNKTNLSTQAVDFIEKGIIDTAKIDFNKRQKEAITTSQINSETFRIGKKIADLTTDGYKTSFTKKIEETVNGKTKLLKINERLTQDDVLVYADIPDDYDNKQIDKVVSQIEIFMFLENLKQSKKALTSYIVNLIDKNTKNFVVNFAKHFSEKRNKYNDLIEERLNTYKENAGKDVDSRLDSKYFSITTIELYEDFNELMAQLEVRTIELEGEIEELKSQDVLTDEDKKELTNFTSELKSVIDFKTEVDKVYEKVTSLNMIDELFESIEANLELTQDELTAKYNLNFDYYTANRKFKISDEIFDLLGELQEVERDSFSRFYLSPKFVQREKKPVIPSYIDEKELEDFRTELMDFLRNEIIMVMDLPLEFLDKLEQHLDFLLNYYFIHKGNFSDKTKDSEKELSLRDFQGNRFEDNPKKFNNPSKEIVKAMEMVGTGLSQFMIKTKVQPKTEPTGKTVKKTKGKRP